jgi:hypothetical protein
MRVTGRNRHTALAADPICPTIPNYASGTDIRYGNTHPYHYIKDRMKDGCPPSKVVDAQSTADHCH